MMNATVMPAFVARAIGLFAISGLIMVVMTAILHEHKAGVRRSVFMSRVGGLLAILLLLWQLGYLGRQRLPIFGWRDVVFIAINTVQVSLAGYGLGSAIGLLLSFVISA